MAKKLVWYEVIDLTSYGVKYPDDWYYRCGHLGCWENSVCESLGLYSSKKKAVDRLRKWSDEKGFKFEPKQIPNGVGVHYLDDLTITVEPIVELSHWYDIYDNPTDDAFKRSYGTGAMVVRKTLTLDEDY